MYGGEEDREEKEGSLERRDCDSWSKEEGGYGREAWRGWRCRGRLRHTSLHASMVHPQGLI